MIISDTILRSLAPPQLRPMKYHQKIMCGCAICNISKYFKELLNTWRRKKLKIMKDETDNSRGRKKDELTQVYQLYADHAFPNYETRHPRFENAADSVLCSPTNDECQYSNWIFVPRKCTSCTSIALPGVERYSSNGSSIIMFNTYMTKFTCSHHGILICKKTTTYLDAKVTYKKTRFLCEKLIQAKTPYFTRGRLYDRVKLFPIQRKIGGFHKDSVNDYIICQRLLLPSCSWHQHAYVFCRYFLLQACYSFSDKWLSIVSEHY